MDSLKKKLSGHAPHHCSQIRIRQQNCSSLIIQTTASTVTAVPATTKIPKNYGILICNCSNDDIENLWIACNLTVGAPGGPPLGLFEISFYMFFTIFCKILRGFDVNIEKNEAKRTNVSHLFVDVDGVDLSSGLQG